MSPIWHFPAVLCGSLYGRSRRCCGPILFRVQSTSIDPLGHWPAAQRHGPKAFSVLN
jgi:hypothetical protein